jgi:hypothetical protein
MTITKFSNFEKFRQNVLDITNGMAEPLEPYKGARVKTLYKCNSSKEHTWYTRYTDIKELYLCPKCCQSKGERLIELILSKHNINYISQKKFIGLVDKGPLSFDFYIPSINTCIEFDGPQHQVACNYFGGEETLLGTKKRDNIKNEYCRNNNIVLIRIPYTQYNYLQEIIEQLLIGNPT